MSSLDVIKTLRERTGAGMLACKNALQENGGDLEKAIEYLRKKGLAAVAKRAGRETSEGLVIARQSADKNTTSLSYLGCETDFVAKTDDFIKLANDVADYVIANPGLNHPEDEKLKEMINAVAPKLGENVTLKEAVVYTSDGSKISNYYIHSDNKKSAIVEVSCDQGANCPNKEKLAEVAKELALQIVAMNPGWLTGNDVPAEVIEKEKEIYRETLKREGKPEAAIDKVLEGKIRKFFEQNCLLPQASIRDAKKTVDQYVADVSKELNTKITVERFYRIG